MPNRLYLFIASIFSMVVILANLLTAKMVTIPFFSQSIPCGLLLYPITFFISDLCVEIFGKRAAKEMIFVGFATSIISSLILQVALLLPAEDAKIQASLSAIFAVNCASLFSSIIAYLASQLLDISLYAKIRSWTGERWLFMRSLGSTLTAQLVDSVIVNAILFGAILHWPWQSVLFISTFSFSYKSVVALSLTPLYYLAVKETKKVLPT